MSPDRQSIPRVAVDCDPGIDDAIALLVLAELHREGSIQLDLVTTVAGNGPLVNSSANARYVLDVAGLRDTPVCPGAAVPLGGHRGSSDGRAFHGPDGLGGLHPRGHRRPTNECSADEQLVGWAMAGSEDGAERWLLCTGPLTNVASALAKLPGLPHRVSRVVVMGGAFGNPSGNITPSAEFNFHVDPQAASVVCASGLPLELIPLDITERVEIRPRDVTGISRTFPGKLLLASIAYTRQAIGLDGCYVHDAIAALAMTRPDLVVTQHAKFLVGTDGEFAGQVTEYPGPSTARRAVRVDVDATRQLLLELLHPRSSQTPLAR